MTPTIGRVVIAKNVSPAVNNGATEAPAVITRVWTEVRAGVRLVNLRVLRDGYPDAGEWETSRMLFDEEPDNDNGGVVYAVWPPRVPS